MIYRCCLFGLLFLYFCTKSQAQNITDSLIFYYNCNGNLEDLSPNGLDAFSDGVYVEDENGNPNSVLSLNGVDNTISIPYSELFKVPLPASYYVRFKLNDYPETQASALLETDYIEDSYYGFRVSVNLDGTLTIVYGDGGPGGPQSRRTKKADPLIELDRWYDLVAVWRGPLDMSIYIGCREIEGIYSGSGGSITYHPGNQDALLGRGDTNQGIPGAFLNCVIDEVGFWNRALNAQDVTDLCQGIEVSTNSLLDLNDLQVFTNPDNTLQINLGVDLDSDYHFSLYNVSGKEMLRTKLTSNRNTIPFSLIHDGIYFYQIINTERTASLGGKISIITD